jgi:hypothetical protein
MVVGLFSVTLTLDQSCVLLTAYSRPKNSESLHFFRMQRHVLPRIKLTDCARFSDRP